MRRIIQWIICSDAFDFQIQSIVFLATVSETGSRFLSFPWIMLSCGIISSKWRDRDRGFPQLTTVDNLSVTAIQKEWTGVTNPRGMKIIICAP